MREDCALKGQRLNTVHPVPPQPSQPQHTRQVQALTWNAGVCARMLGGELELLYSLSQIANTVPNGYKVAAATRQMRCK